MKNPGAGENKILLVEDEPVITQVCLRVLTSSGYQVDIASNGTIAIDMLAKGDYDLILIDIRTPVMNGKQLYEYIRERHPRLTNRAVFTTGDVMSSEIQQFLEQSGRPSLLKPFTPEELKAIVREALSQRY